MPAALTFSRFLFKATQRFCKYLVVFLAHCRIISFSLSILLPGHDLDHVVQKSMNQQMMLHCSVSEE